ncbi:MAG: patatin-like phospholipase family protein [Deltaproteobacteria bacterium]|nr:patatin-like phospholipase family protein [Deltaproteobacteria bacterium]MBW2172356.1 patatin-like phospholipase family protein [Deltaproteobacteria bacterium]
MKIGLALGGGGVRGMAHIAVLEALDELGLRPNIIAGTSMGAIVGALYASGMDGRAIRQLVQRHIILKDDKLRDLFDKKGNLLKWVQAFSIEFSRGGLISSDRFLHYLLNEIQKTTFEDLEIPLLVIATDYWTAEEVVFEKGDLLPAIQASMAVPGVFAPVSIDERVLVDGGVVNLVPYDHLLERTDLTIAIDVGRIRTIGEEPIPSALESVLGTFDIMQTAALTDKMRHRKPDIYVRMEIHDVRMLDFGKVEEVFQQAKPSVEALRKELANRKLLPDAD